VVGTYRADELASAERVRRLADTVGRSGAAVALDLGPLAPAELAALIEARAGPAAPALADVIVARSEGNPFFAEELLAAAGEEDGELPRGLRDLLLRRVVRLDRRTKGLLRLASTAGRDVGYPLLRAAARLPEGDVRDSLRSAVETASCSGTTRRGAFASATRCSPRRSTRRCSRASARRCTRLAEELARGEPPATAAQLAPHWAAAGRSREALAASVEAARAAQAVFGLAEALAHLERAVRCGPTWRTRPSSWGWTSPSSAPGRPSSPS
jgi:hypothetical protein